MTTYETKEQATEAAIREHGSLAVEIGVVNVIKVGSTMAKFYDCKEGYAIASNG
jgi:hypothetical protein